MMTVDENSRLLMKDSYLSWPIFQIYGVTEWIVSPTLLDILVKGLEMGKGPKIIVPQYHEMPNGPAIRDECHLVKLRVLR